jgi:tetratricopeptide (TPR) repeat protein
MPQTTYMEVDPRRDHSLRVPRPDLSVQFHTPNACTGCHLRDKVLPGRAGQGAGGQESGVRGQESGDSEPVDLKALLVREDLKEYADWLAAARRGDRQVRARLAQVDRWADATLESWYGASRKREPHFTAALHAAREMTADAPPLLVDLLKDRQQPAVARATAALELAAYAEPRGAVIEALRGALDDRDPQVRAAAILSLQQDGSDATVSALVPLLSDPTRLVRTEAARALALAGSHRLQGDERTAFKAALQECLDAVQVDNDRAAGHMTLGILYESLGQQDEALAAYRTALKVEPESIGPRTNIAAIYDRQLQEAQQRAQQLHLAGDRAGAERAIYEIASLPAEIERLRSEELALLERDARLAPDNAAIQGRIGLARYLGGWRKEAESALRNAVLLDPQNPEHLYRLAIYYKDTGRPEQAAPLAQRLLELRPGHPPFEQLAAELP